MRKAPPPPSYLTKQANVWSFQIRVPNDVQAGIGRKVIRQSLKTGDVNAARRQAQPLIDAWMRRFSEIRAGEGGRKAAIETLAKIGYDFGGGIDSFGEIDPLLPPDRQEGFARQISDIERRSAERRFAFQRDRLSQLIPGIDPQIALAPLRAEIAARLDAVERAVSVITGEQPAPPPVDLATLEAAFRLWEEETKPARSSLCDARLAVRIFTDLFGALPLTSVTRQHAAEFLRALKDLPTRVPAADRKLNTRQLIAKYQGDETRRPDLATANKKFGLIRAMINRTIKAGIIERNPFDGVQIDVVKKKAPRVPFDDGDVRKLFDALGDQSESMQWIARLGLITGARLAELVQLRCADVVTEGNVTFITISNEDDEHGARSTKTAGSVRRVPIRAELAPGLVAYASRRNGLLFADLQPKTGGASNIASKRAMRWIRGAEVTDSRKAFHSFRHLFIDLCREHGVPEEVRNALSGHSGGDHVGRRYGNGVPLAVLSDAMAKLRFPVDLEGVVE